MKDIVAARLDNKNLIHARIYMWSNYFLNEFWAGNYEQYRETLHMSICITKSMTGATPVPILVFTNTLFYDLSSFWQSILSFTSQIKITKASGSVLVKFIKSQKGRENSNNR